ncbi:MAG: CoxE, partial [Thermoleophilaceae bacterium]|nr:CoxE [Thermoleophilaceae bacterium]
MESSRRGGAPEGGAGGGRAAGARFGGLYGGLPPREGPPGLDARLLELGDELRREGVAVGTSELLDAFGALAEVSWTDHHAFRDALAATLAKSQEDRRIFDALFERFFFRAVEREAVEKGLTEQRFSGEGAGQEIDFDSLREAVRAAIRAGSDGEMRDLARLSIAALGRQGEGSGVIGVDVQRIRRSLRLKGEPSAERQSGGVDPDAVPADRLRDFERHLRRELERDMVERTQSLPPARPLRELDRALPSAPLQDLAAVHRVAAQLKRRLATQGHQTRGRRRTEVV